MVRDSEDLQLQLKVALQKCNRTRAAIDQSDDHPNVGDLYAFPETSFDGIEWAIVLQNRDDDSFWFAVPLDQNPMIGTWDVVISDLSDSGPATLRCGRGIWIHSSDLRKSHRSGYLEALYVEDARARLAAMVGEDFPIKSRAHVDDDPDYQEWLDEVSQATERLEASFRDTFCVLKLADFDTSWIGASGIHTSSPVALAADTAGLGAGPSEEILPLAGKIVADNLPGVLVALLGEEGIHLIYHVATREKPPSVRLVVHNTEHCVTWRQLSAAVLESDQTITVDESVSIYVDGKHRCVLTA